MLRLLSFSKYALFLSSILLTSCVIAQKKEASTAKTRSPSGFNRVAERPAITSDQKIMQELTGKSDSVFSKADLKRQPLSVQHLYVGQKAAQQKNYIAAIRNYNAIIKKYPRSPEFKKALVAKANLYKEMGLNEPAQLNLRLANRSAAKSKSKVASVREKQKITK